MIPRVVILGYRRSKESYAIHSDGVRSTCLSHCMLALDPWKAARRVLGYTGNQVSEGMTQFFERCDEALTQLTEFTLCNTVKNIAQQECTQQGQHSKVLD